jgi:hypothetical protein
MSQRSADMKALGQRWRVFLDVVLDPGVACFLISTVALIFLSSIQKLGDVSAATMNVLITLSAALLGGRAWQQWTDANEEGALIARGNLAVRNLSLLLRNISSLNARVKSFLKREDHITGNPDVTKRNYEEAINTCSLLMEQTISAIENWTDVVPGANVKTQIGVLSDLTEKLSAAESELETTKAAIVSVRTEERARMQERLEEIRSSVDKLKYELRKASDRGPLSSIANNATISELAYSPMSGRGVWPFTSRGAPGDLTGVFENNTIRLTEQAKKQTAEKKADDEKKVDNK